MKTQTKQVIRLIRLQSSCSSLYAHPDDVIMNNAILPESTKTRLSTMSSEEKASLLSDFETVVDMDGFCDWVSYAFIVELRG